ncbi:MAG: hypothetical protein JXC32_09000 [Anaerolineae bacterium]|nr:hypothetical protein [Anaerolineae bacterium]
MSEQQSENDRGYDEKDHAMEEKELQKHEEKYNEKTEEKSFEEKHRQDPVGSMVWAATLVWAGLVLLANNLGWLKSWRIQLGDTGFDMPFEIEAWVGVWQLFFLGAGVLVLVGVVARLLMPEYRRPILGNLIWAIVLFGIAVGQWELIWPLILIAIGVSLLFGGVVGRR